MEKIITLKVDLEHPDEAKFAIDAAAEAYEESKKCWDSFELDKAKHIAFCTACAIKVTACFGRSRMALSA